MRPWTAPICAKEAPCSRRTATRVKYRNPMPRNWVPYSRENRVSLRALDMEGSRGIGAARGGNALQW
jgi:hypothetical protein